MLQNQEGGHQVPRRPRPEEQAPRQAQSRDADEKVLPQGGPGLRAICSRAGNRALHVFRWRRLGDEPARAKDLPGAVQTVQQLGLQEEAHDGHVDLQARAGHPRNDPGGVLGDVQVDRRELLPREDQVQPQRREGAVHPLQWLEPPPRHVGFAQGFRVEEGGGQRGFWQLGADYSEFGQ